LRDTVLNELQGMGVQRIAGYANDYSQYVSTKEEYDVQHCIYPLCREMLFSGTCPKKEASVSSILVRTETAYAMREFGSM
jgi:hypothetical protein